ncbi:unnamed protein product [Peronospora effusa]|uniref:RxLR effector protein n=1 Tax=Peronospora effusa TaxID=542832 RepID=A0A3R7WKT6_9STRA|nr:hypothetical protein DD237_008589 [Peronospora effusa]CAI5728680.1 unnamed protein product [Peronospora effusa]
MEVDLTHKEIRVGSEGMVGPLEKTYIKLSNFFNHIIQEKWNDLTRLKNMFGESKTVEMLASTSKVSFVEKRTKVLLDQQYRLWMNEGRDAEDVKSKLLRDGVSEGVAKKLFDEYDEYVKKTPVGYPASSLPIVLGHPVPSVPVEFPVYIPPSASVGYSGNPPPSAS